MARKHSPLIPKERFNIHLEYPKSASDFIESLRVLMIFVNPERAGPFFFNSQVRGLVGVKDCNLKPRTFVL
jgi:hypothetical protein